MESTSRSLHTALSVERNTLLVQHTDVVPLKLVPSRDVKAEIPTIIVSALLSDEQNDIIAVPFGRDMLVLALSESQRRGLPSAFP